MEKNLMEAGGGLVLGPSTALCPRWASVPQAPSLGSPHPFGESQNFPGHGCQRRLEHPPASPHLSVGSLGTLGYGWKFAASNLCFPPLGSMSQSPVQQQRDGVQPQANDRDGAQPLHPDPSGRNGPGEELQGPTGKGVCAWSMSRGSGFAEDSGKGMSNSMVLMRWWIAWCPTEAYPTLEQKPCAGAWS